jgi:hypothetical protein
VVHIVLRASLWAGYVRALSRAGERRGDAVTLIVERRIGGRALVVALAGAGEWAAEATKAFVAADLEREDREKVTI